jgi:hypothetical protein
LTQRESTPKRDSRLWHKQTNEEDAARIGCQLAASQDKLLQPRRDMARNHGSMYEGFQLEGLDGDCFDSLVPVSYDGAPLVNNRCQSIVDTLQAKLASLDEPRPQFVVTDGTYEQKRQAVWLDRFIEGQYYQRQGLYNNVWHMWRHAFLLAAAATGTAAVKIFPDGKRIACELRNTLDMWIDPLECRYGAPLTYGEDTWVDAEKLADENPRFADDIWRCSDEGPRASRNGQEAFSRQVRVHELWRVKTGDTDGKYLRCVANKALDFADFKYTTPPYAFYHFRQRLGGFWGASATSTLYQSVIRENQVLNRMDEGEARSQTIIQYYDPNVQGNDKIVAPKHVLLIAYDSDKGAPPQPFAMPWYAQQAPELMRIHAQNAHDTTGASIMQTTGQAQTGLTAAVAIRTVLSLLNERFAPRQRDIVQAVAVDSAYLFARAAKEICEEHGEFSSEWHGKGFIKTMPGADCLDLPAEIYTAQVRPVSEKKNSPEDRIQLAQELVTQGLITGGDWLDVLRTMDTPGAAKKYERTEAFCEKLFDKFRQSKDSELSEPGFYISPPKLGVDLDYMMALATDAYLSALIDEIPEERTHWFLKFLGDVNRKIDQRDTRRQAMGMKPQPAATPGLEQGAKPPAELPAQAGV